VTGARLAAGRGKHDTLWFWLLATIFPIGFVFAAAVESASIGPVDSKAIEARRVFAQNAVEYESARSAPNEPSSVLTELSGGNLVRGATVRYVDSSGNPLMFRQLSRPARASRLSP